MALPGSALATLDDVKSELGLSDSSADTLLERYILAATGAITAYCNRTFHCESGIAESVAGYGEPFLALSRRPIVALSSIAYDGTAIDSNNYSLHDASAGLVHSDSGWAWTASEVAGLSYQKVAGTEERKYSVTYTGGYVTAQQAQLGEFATRTLPYDLEEACIEMACERYHAKGKDNRVVQESMLSYSVQYAQGVIGYERMSFSGKVLATLSRYRSAL